MRGKWAARKVVHLIFTFIGVETIFRRNKNVPNLLSYSGEIHRCEVEVTEGGRKIRRGARGMK